MITVSFGVMSGASKLVSRGTLKMALFRSASSLSTKNKILSDIMAIRLIFALIVNCEPLIELGLSRFDYLKVCSNRRDGRFLGSFR